MFSVVDGVVFADTCQHSHMCCFPAGAQTEDLSAQFQCQPAIRKTGRRGNTFLRIFVKSTTVLSPHGLYTPKVKVSIKHVSTRQLYRVVVRVPPITLDNQTIIFYYYKEVSIECLCQHWHPPAHSQHRSCSDSKPTLNKCALFTGVFLCGHVSVYMCIHHICRHVTHLGISLEMSCYVTALSLRVVGLSNVFSEHYDKFLKAASGKITSWTLTRPDSTRSHSLRLVLDSLFTFSSTT